MDAFTLIIGSVLALFLTFFVLRLFYTIMINLINGRKFHHQLEQEFNRLRLGNMLSALGINKTEYIYQTNVQEIKKQMDSCSACSNTDVCDEKLADSSIEITEIEFCNNEADLIKIDQQQKAARLADE